MSRKRKPIPAWAQSDTSPFFVFEDAGGVINFSRPIAKAFNSKLAKLIVAVPDTLAALKYAEETLREGPPTRESIVCVTHLQAVIAKAEGK